MSVLPTAVTMNRVVNESYRVHMQKRNAGNVTMLCRGSIFDIERSIDLFKCNESFKSHTKPCSPSLGGHLIKKHQKEHNNKEGLNSYTTGKHIKSFSSHTVICLRMLVSVGSRGLDRSTRLQDICRTEHDGERV